MTNKDAIESFKHSNEQAKVRLEVEKMRMDNDEIKELEFYIERDEIAIKALEQEPILDKIRAEIEQAKDTDFQRNRKTYNKCLEIIDHYKAESEEN